MLCWNPYSEFLELNSYRKDFLKLLDYVLDLIVHALELIDLNAGLIYCILYPQWRVRQVRLRINAVPTQEGHYLLHLRIPEFLPVLSSKLHRAFLDYLFCNLVHICCLELRFHVSFAGMHSFLDICEDLVESEHIPDLNRLALLEIYRFIKIHKDFKFLISVF